MLRPREAARRREWATPADVLLVVEVSDTSLGRDRDIKLPIYARAGIAFPDLRVAVDEVFR